MKISVIPEIRIYTEHPEARSFKAPEVDPEAPELKYKDKKEREKKDVALQNMVGASGYMTAELVVQADLEIKRLDTTIDEFEDPSVEMKDARKEAAEVLAAVRDNIVRKFGKQMMTVCSVLANSHNLLTMTRRQPRVDLVTNSKNARTIVKRLQPSDQYLFGGKLADVAKHLKDSSQVDNLISIIIRACFSS